MHDIRIRAAGGMIGTIAFTGTSWIAGLATDHSSVTENAISNLAASRATRVTRVTRTRRLRNVRSGRPRRWRLHRATTISFGSSKWRDGAGNREFALHETNCGETTCGER